MGLFHFAATYMRTKGGFIMLFSLEEKGQGLVEYALILLLIALVVIGALAITGTTLNETYVEIQNAIPVP